jgi:hypothetical protein
MTQKDWIDDVRNLVPGDLPRTEIRPGDELLILGMPAEPTKPPPAPGVRIVLWGKRDVPIAIYDLLPPGNLYAEIPFLAQIKDQVTRIEVTWM